MNRPPIQQDFHDEQSTVRITCLGCEGAQIQGGEPLATGLYVRLQEKSYLVTNWHVVSGKHPSTENQIGNFIPHELEVFELHGARSFRIPLYANDRPVWMESARRTIFECYEQRIDVAIIPIQTELSGIDVPESIATNFTPLEQVSIVGFPYTRSRPIWKTGHIAESIQSTPDYFLVNGRTKAGMSGSGVFSPFFSWEGKYLYGQLAGIYSGRYNDNGRQDTLNDLDIGVVWKADLIMEIIQSPLQ